MSRARKNLVKRGTTNAFAWEVLNDSYRTIEPRWELCRWAEATRAALRDSGKPSPEARIVAVRLVRR